MSIREAHGLEQVFGQRDHLVGLAAAWGQPSDGALRDQYVVEAFYRFYLTRGMHLTPDVQILVQPSRAPEYDVIAVFGLRLRVLF